MSIEDSIASTEIDDCKGMEDIGTVMFNPSSSRMANSVGGTSVFLRKWQVMLEEMYSSIMENGVSWVLEISWL